MLCGKGCQFTPVLARRKKKAIWVQSDCGQTQNLTDSFKQTRNTYKTRRQNSIRHFEGMLKLHIATVENNYQKKELDGNIFTVISRLITSTTIVCENCSYNIFFKQKFKILIKIKN